MFGQQIATDIAKRDAIRIYVDRLVEWLGKSKFNLDDARTELDRAYRKGWSDAMDSARRHLLGS